MDDQYGFRTACRNKLCLAPRAGGAWTGGQQKAVSLAAKLKAAEEREKVLENIEIWGQPRAWTDELVVTWVIDRIKSERGQAVVFADC